MNLVFRMSGQMKAVIDRLNDLYSQMTTIEAEVLVDTEGKLGPWLASCTAIALEASLS